MFLGTLSLPSSIVELYPSRCRGALNFSLEYNYFYPPALGRLSVPYSVIISIPRNGELILPYSRIVSIPLQFWVHPSLMAKIGSIYLQWGPHFLLFWNYLRSPPVAHSPSFVECCLPPAKNQTPPALDWSPSSPCLLSIRSASKVAPLAVSSFRITEQFPNWFALWL